MVNPETNLLCIARRVLAMADRIGNTAIPEEIANEAKSELHNLKLVKEESVLRRFAVLLVIRLTRYCDEPRNSTARAAFYISLKQSAENLRGSIRMEELHCGEREAA
jgi:hypothetical protein